MKPPTPIASNPLERILRAADAAWDRRDFPDCIGMLQRASHLDPSNPEILLRLGHIQGLCYDYAAAERCFEQALRLASRKGVMLTAIAEHCRDFRNPALAERYLRKALEVLEQTNVWPPTGLELARLCERTRRLPEATQLVDRVLAAVPTYPAALLLRARLERTAGRLEAAEQVLRSFITKPVPLVWTHAQAWYELATVLDRQEKYDEAMTAFFNAKSLLQPQAPGYLQALKQTRAYLKVMEENVSAEQLRRWFENGPALPPSRRLALLCGHARSGTTLLEQVLDAHPDIVSVEESPIFLNDAYLPVRRKSAQNAHMLPALESFEKEEVPVGAVIVRGGKIIARASNQVEELKDATAHAEMLALTQAESAVGDWRLTDCTLYVTKEPCPMCAGAVVHTRLARVVFGAGDPKGGAAGGVMNLLQFPTLNHRCEITGGVREAECRALLQKFFSEQRLAQKAEKKNGRIIS